MADHDQRKNQPPSGVEGHHQVHHCHKCGWPFPNPHPSAKHRRAHRRICGTIEGYRLEGSQHSNVSDDEHSDDDYKTPSARALERSESGKGSGGFDERSNKSEDEVFSDAPSNFVDNTSSTVTEAALVTVLESESSIENVKEDVPAHRTAEVMQADDSTDNAEKPDPVVPQSTADVSGSKLSAADDSLSSLMGTLVESAEESTASTIGLKNDLNDDSIIIDKPSISSTLEAKKPDEDIAVVPESTVDVFGSKPVDPDQISSSPMGTLIDSAEESTAATIRQDNVPTDDSVLIEPKPSVGLISEAKEPDEDIAVLPESTGVYGSKPGAPDNFSISPMGGFVDSTEESTAATIRQENDLTDHSVTIESKPSISLISEAKKPDEDIAVSKCLSESASPDIEAKAVEETAPLSCDDSHSSDTPEAAAKLGIGQTATIPNPQVVKMVEETSQLSLDGDSASRTPEKIPKLEEACKLDAPRELSPEEKAPNQASLSGDASISELNMDQGLEVSTSGNGIREIDEIEEDKFTLFSVPHGVPVVEDPVRLVEGFKDHKRTGWFQPDNSGTSDGILKDDVVIASPPESQPEAVTESSEVSLDLQELKVPSESVKKCNPVDEEAFIEGKLISHHENQGLANLETCEDDVAADSEEVSGVVNVTSEMKFSGSGLDEKDKAELTHVTEADQAEKHVERYEVVPEFASKMEKFKIAEEDDNSKRVTEEGLIQIAVAPGSAQNLHEVQDNLIANPIKDQGTLSHKNQEIEEPAEAEEDARESAGHVQESREADNKDVGYSEILMQAEDRASDSHKNPDEVEMIGKDKGMQLSSGDRVVDETAVSLDTSLVQASVATEVGGADGGPGCFPVQHEGDTNHVKPLLAGSAHDASADSRSTDSLDANWGSVSETVVSTQSDAPAAVEDSKAKPEAGKSNSIPKLDFDVTKGSDKSETYEPPSFMTLVEPSGKGEKTATSSDQGQPGWFPSLTNVSNDSPGRKKNEEIIAKVTNWSSNQQQHSPLKSLLIEANRDAKPKLPKPGENTPVEAQKEKSVTVGSILGSENQKGDEVKQAAAAQEWNSPARYPAEIKREKRKVKGRPIWAQFVCCSSSVN